MPYAKSKASLLTQHGKESIICPELMKTNGLEVIHVSDFDTDQLGTFTRETPRFGSQLEAARKKARIGMELARTSIGIASEGAFSNDPVTGLVPWNYELVILIDEVRKIEILGICSGPAQSAHKEVSSWDELIIFLSAANFPTHQLVVRPDDENHPICRKGVHDHDSLRESFDWAMNLSKYRKVFVENDLRAHTNPTRMANIEKATQNLAFKLNSICPKCDSPGFGIAKQKAGLLCSCCELPTDLPIANIWTCVNCQCIKEEAIEFDKKADPSKCNHCNP